MNNCHLRRKAQSFNELQLSTAVAAATRIRAKKLCIFAFYRVLLVYLELKDPQLHHDARKVRKMAGGHYNREGSG